MADLFLSYARADSREFVARLSAALADRGKETWVDLDDIPPASSWNDDLRAGIAGSDAFCYVISPASVTSPHCRSELEHAVALGKRIVPVLHLPVADAEVPEAVGSRNWIPQTGRFTDDFDAALGTLVVAIETDLEWVREHTRWGLRAEEWERRNEDSSLLARGSDLSQAEAFIGRGGHEPQPTELQGRYVVASRRSASRRQRRLFTGVSVALVVSLVLGVLALFQRNTAVAQRREADSQRREAVAQRQEADKQRADATSRALAANAFLNLPTDPELSVLLALQAVAASPTREAEDALRSSILDSRVRMQLDHDDAVNSASYRPDGSRIVTTSVDGTAVLWDAVSGEKVADLTGAEADPVTVAWSADGTRFAVIFRDGTTRVYDGETGETVSVTEDPDQPHGLTDVVMSGDGSLVATSGFGGNVHVWNVDDETLLTTIPRMTGGQLALSPDDSLLLLDSGSAGPGIELWSVREGGLVAAYPEEALSATVVSFSPDGRLFVTASGDGRTRVRNLAGDVVADVQQGAAVNDAAFSPDGSLLATASADGTAAVTDLSTGQRVSTYTGHAGGVDAVAFNTAGDLAASGGEDGTVQLWRPGSGDQVAVLSGHRAPVHGVAFSPVGEEILSASYDSTARIWSASPTGGAFPEDASVPAPMFGAQWTRLTSDASHQVRETLWDDAGIAHLESIDVATGELSSRLDLDDDGSAPPAISPDGALVVTTSSDRTRIRRLDDGSVVSEISVPDSVRAAAFDAIGQQVLLVPYGTPGAIYDVASGRLLVTLQGEGSFLAASGAAYSHDGTKVATTSDDGTALVWDASTGEQLLSLDAFGPADRQQEQVATVAFSPDDTLLATAAHYEPDARLWDTSTGERVVALEGRSIAYHDLSDLAFSSTGRFLVTSELDGLVRMWDGHSGRPLATIRDRGTAVLHAASEVVFAAAFTTDEKAIVVATQADGGQLETIICEVCVDLDALVELGESRVTRELTDTEKATYLTDQ